MSKPANVTLAPILYAKTEIGGITVRPDSREVMKKAAQGHPVLVGSGNDYINLYHVFDRLKEGDKSLSKKFLMRQQVGPSKWILTVTTDKAEVEQRTLDQGYDPKRGRYKRYAEELAAEGALTLPSREEAVKARRAWQLYTHQSERKEFRTSIRKLPREGGYQVLIFDK